MTVARHLEPTSLNHRYAVTGCTPFATAHSFKSTIASYRLLEEQQLTTPYALILALDPSQPALATGVVGQDSESPVGVLGSARCPAPPGGGFAAHERAHTGTSKATLKHIASRRYLSLEPLAAEQRLGLGPALDLGPRTLVRASPPAIR